MRMEHGVVCKYAGLNIGGFECRRATGYEDGTSKGLQIYRVNYRKGEYRGV